MNPLLTNDELGLHADYGLEYLEPDPVGHVAFPDGEQLTMWLDLDRTCEEIARFSRRDAEAYRRLIAEYDEVKGIFGRPGSRRRGSGPRSRRCCSSTRAGASGSGATRSPRGT